MRIKSLMHAPISFAAMMACCSIITVTCVSNFDLSQGGSGTEIGNPTVTGMVVDAQGSPAGNVQVTIRSSGFDPVTDGPTPDSDMVTTGPDGIYSVSVAKNRTYTIEAVHRSRRTRAMLADVAVGEVENLAPQCTLNVPGVIKVVVPWNADTAGGFVFIPGTSIFSMVKFSRGFVLLDSVPVGCIPQIAYSSTNGAAATTLRYSVTVTAGDTAVVGNPFWKYSRTLRLNTSATGANTAGNVLNFPVLIRLTAANFDFTQARNNGEDIRFAKRDNTFLPYEIERWDAIAGLAEVWVKADTVYGNDSAQAITMYWDNIDAPAQSNGTAVFDTAAGFAGVWHLGESGGAVASDATVNGINGIATATTPVAGIVGTAQMFNGTSSFIEASGPASDRLNFQDNDPYSLCAWVNANAIDTFHAIVFKSNFQYGLQIRPEKSWEFFNYASGTGWQWTQAPASANSWHFVTGVWSGSKQYLYVDGIVVDSARGVTAWSASRVFSSPFQIGNCPDGAADVERHFSGVIDEVRVEKNARSADWIKLCYMNQKKPDALVKW